jgi:hypothetical protein
MMTRNIYIASSTAPYFTVKRCTFDGVSGFAKSRAQENVRRLHATAARGFHLDSILEVSSASTDELGLSLSAFNLKNAQGDTVEALFQASKKFANGGPYRDLLTAKRGKAKKDERLRNSGPLVAFVGPYSGREYPLKPTTAYYDFLYIRTLLENGDLCQEIIDRDLVAFSDIWFNPDKSLNCQAEACSIFAGLMKAGKEVPEDFDEFVRMTWGGAA